MELVYLVNQPWTAVIEKKVFLGYWTIPRFRRLQLNLMSCFQCHRNTGYRRRLDISFPKKAEHSLGVANGSNSFSFLVVWPSCGSSFTGWTFHWVPWVNLDGREVSYLRCFGCVSYIPFAGKSYCNPWSIRLDPQKVRTSLAPEW